MKIAVLGVGSSGIVSLSHLLSWCPKDWEITSIHNPKIPILGIGESTNPTFLKSLEYSLPYFNLYDLLNEGSNGMDATLKLGTVFKKWRDHEFINPLLGSNPGCAMHIDTYKLQKYCIPRFKEKWKEKFKEIHGNIDSINDMGSSVNVVVDGTIHNYDYVVDCMGFPTSYDEYTKVDVPVNHCLVHNIKKDGSNFLHTGHVATKDGWMFEVPLQTRVSYGYMFNDNITSIEQAKINFSKEIGVSANELENIEYKFSSYYSNNVLSGRIMKNGNKAAFFEPMFANSLWIYERAIRLFYDFIMGASDHNIVNASFRHSCYIIYENICLFYHGGSLYKTSFWEHAVNITSPVINKSDNLQIAKNELSKDYKDNYGFSWGFSPLGLKIIDKNFGYNYFN